MARRSREELKAEFDRLYDVFELFLEFELSQVDEEHAAFRKSLVPTREQVLSLVGKDGVTMSNIVDGTRQAINDQNEMLSIAAEDGEPFASEFLEFYKARTGRNYFDDAGNLSKIARTIFKRGEIADEMEFRLLMGVLNNVEQTVFKGKEVERVSEMLYRFEQSVDKN